MKRHRESSSWGKGAAGSKVRIPSVNRKLPLGTAVPLCVKCGWEELTSLSYGDAEMRSCWHEPGMCRVSAGICWAKSLSHPM